MNALKHKLKGLKKSYVKAQDPVIRIGFWIRALQITGIQDGIWSRHIVRVQWNWFNPLTYVFLFIVILVFFSLEGNKATIDGLLDLFKPLEDPFTP